MFDYHTAMQNPDFVRTNTPRTPTQAIPGNAMTDEAAHVWNKYMNNARAQTQALNQAPGIGIPGQTGAMTPEGYEQQYKQLQALFSKIGGLGGLGGLFTGEQAEKTPEELAEEQYYAKQLDPNTPAYR
jgi:hypothetical protein